MKHRYPKAAFCLGRFVCAPLMIALVLAGSSLANTGAERAEAVKLNDKERRVVIDAAARHLRESYVFSDKGAAYAIALEQAHKSGHFSGANDGVALAAALTDHLRQISRDKHMQVDFSPEPLPENLIPEQPDDAMRKEANERARWQNYGIAAVQRLPCNIGYLNLRGFDGNEAASSAFAAAMTLLSGTDALIIDLRENTGGSPQTVALLASYFFDQRTRLNDIINPQVSKEPTQFWTQDNLEGPRYGTQRPVYILTSKDTFSAAEDFSYAMKNLKRATLVGETTGGGAHPVMPARLSAHLYMAIPFARSESPITKTDWEGVGVEPDIKIIASKALERAQLDLLRQLLSKETRPPRAEGMRDRMATLEAAL